MKKNHILWDIFNEQFEDLFLESHISYDVILPVLNTNFLFEKNLNSIYKNIPVNRLLVGDAGCIDETISCLAKYPRVEIFDHKNFKTSGVCIADLIDKVRTERFFYMHSDVFIPNRQTISVLEANSSDWIEGYRHHLAIVLDDPTHYYTDTRSYSGVQLGNTKLLQHVTKNIEDGDLQRNEDIVIAELVKNNNGIFHKELNSIHFHQILDKDGFHEPKIKSLSVIKESNLDWEVRNYYIQIRGIVKYLSPKKYLILELKYCLLFLKIHDKYDNLKIQEILKLNPVWGQHFNVSFDYSIKLSLIFANLRIIPISRLIRFLFL